MFALIAWRPPTRYFSQPTGPAWRAVTVEDQWTRFVEDVPPEVPPGQPRHCVNAHFYTHGAE